MAKTNLLDTKTVSLNEILGNGKIYRVPQFQGDYSWSHDNWEDLWNDVERAAQYHSPHYMGSVVLQSQSSKEFLIIDGQQRFTTLSILALAVIAAIRQLAHDGIEPEANMERADLLMRQYIGHKDPASLSYTSKLFLNENNDGFYQHRLVAFREPPQPTRLTLSEKLLWDSYQYFKNKIREKFKGQNGTQLADFLNNVSGELMMFIQITVEDELNAYTVFETLNSRGVELTSTDLLKNYLFSLVAKSETDLGIIKTQWKKIIDNVGLREFPAFLRHYLMATRKSLSKEYLFKEVKQFVKTNEDVFELTDQLERYAYHYTALGNPDDERWGTDKEIRSFVAALKAFKVTQWKPLAMIALERMDTAQQKKLLQAIVSLSYRYNIIAKLQSNEMESAYSRAAINLHTGKSSHVLDVLGDLKGIYVEDEQFKQFFMSKQFNTANGADKKLARYTLYLLEAQETGGAKYDYELDNGTIEHILPESYPDTWKEYFSEESFEQNVYQLGNLTLLEPSKNNKEAAEKAFDEKVKVFQTSKYALTKQIEGPQWAPKNIQHRQAKLAKLATAVWKIQFK